MKSIKSILFAAVAATLALTSCSSDDYSYSVGEKSSGAYMTAAKSSFVYTPGQEQVLTLGVGRTDYAEAGQVTLEGNNDAFQVPASVSFAAGEKEKSIDIPFTLNTGETTKLTVKVTSATSAYAADSVVVTVKCDYVWESLGTGKYYDSFFFSEPYDVEILQCTAVPNMYRIIGAYQAAIEAGDIDDNPDYPATEEIDITIYNTGDTYAGQTITFDGLVGYDVIHSGYYNTANDYNTEIYIYHPSEGFKNHDTPDTWAFNKVLSYQETQSNGVNIPGQVQLAPYYYMYGVGGWNYADGDGAIIITFPGFVIKDFSMDVTYAGIFTSTTDDPYAVVYLVPGEDVAEAKAVVVAASEDSEEVAAAIAAGTIEAVDATSSQVNVPIPAGMTGKMKVVVAVLDEGEVKTVESVNFEYYGGAPNPWVSLGTGILTDNFVVTMYSPDQVSVFDPLTYAVEVEENSDYPGLYRVVDAFKTTAEFLECDYTSANLEINAIDPDGVYFETQETGMDDGDGMTYIASTGGYYLQNYDFATLKSLGYFGTLKDGVITLPTLTTQSGSSYQGIFMQGTGAWYAGTVGEFKLVLPSAASAAAKRAAVVNSKARSFEKRLNAYNKLDKSSMKNAMRALKLKKVQKGLK